MSSQILTTKTIRLPAAMAELAEQAAIDEGLTFNDIVEIAVAKHLGLPLNPAFELLEAVRDYLQAEYPPGGAFPQDVTRRVFRHLRTNKKLWAKYLAAIEGKDGQADERLRGAVHRRIGKRVKAVLGAVVVGRSLPLDPAVELIRSHALLAPGDPTEVQT